MLTAIANAVIECPEGNENWSGGKIVAQQCGSSWHGRFRRLARLTNMKIDVPSAAASDAAPTAANRSRPPKISSTIPSAYHNQPSPQRVA